MSVRTRFAPSPTGYLHVGGARTALFCYLYARKMGGQFILRVEDTDRERSTEASVQAILDGMAWLGLEADEGPFFQTHRMDRYQSVIEQLLNEGHAYRCYCSKQELDEMRESQQQQGLKTRYDGRWRERQDTPEGIEPVIRFKNPIDGSVAWDDAVKGRIEVANSELDDLIIARSDGSPTYNLTVVVDDIDMQISHVVRGDDHVNNTPRQINIYHALKAELPIFAHVPMILGEDGARLSKRHGAVSVMQYRDDGYLPEALLNYLVRLGWSHGDQEVFSVKEMIDLFDLTQVNRAASTFNTQKLNWLNHQYIQQQEPAYVAEHLSWHLHQQGVDVVQGPKPADIVTLLADRASDLKQMAEQAAFLYHEFEAYEEKAAKKQFKAAALGPLQALKDKFAGLESWEITALHDAIQQVVDELEVGFGKVGQPLRLAITGRAAAPANDQCLQLLGREKSLARIDRAIAFIREKSSSE